VGIRLVVEVLDHYHGPDHKFRWLVAFAEKAKDSTRTGWPGREIMARRTGKSAARVSNLAAELVADGVLERAGGGGRGRGNARYTLLPLAISQGSPSTNPMGAVQGSPSTNPKVEVKGSRERTQGSPSTNPIQAPHSSSYNPQNPQPPAGTVPVPNAQTILGDFIDWDRASGGTLTRRTIGQLAKQITSLLSEGIDDRHIRNGLAAWRAREMHPSTLDSFVNAAMNGHTASPRQHRPSTGDRAIAEGEALKAQLRNHRELA
jgi:hypothetical protein